MPTGSMWAEAGEKVFRRRGRDVPCRQAGKQSVKFVARLALQENSDGAIEANHLTDPFGLLP